MYRRRNAHSSVALVVVFVTCICLSSDNFRPVFADDPIPSPWVMPKLAVGEPPPLPKVGKLAAPRSLKQVGLSDSLTPLANPRDNSQSAEKIALGERLFFDSRLSVDNTVACSTCHDPARAFTDGRPVAIGVVGRQGQRNSPTALNAVFNKTQFWDGRVQSLEEQAELPIINSVEMGRAKLEDAVMEIARIEEYRLAFRKAFDAPVNGPDLLRAIASYERSLVSFDSAFDHFIDGDKAAIDTAAQRGWELFNSKARCNKCHALNDTERDTTNFTDHDFHNIGIGTVRHGIAKLVEKANEELNASDLAEIDQAAIQTDYSELGRFLLTKKQSDIAAFKTPGLRNLLLTSPYFHDGSQVTLWDVVDHYNKGAGTKNPWLDSDIQPLALSEDDIDDIVAFLASLTSPEYYESAQQELKRQKALSLMHRPQRDTQRAFGPIPSTAKTAK